MFAFEKNNPFGKIYCINNKNFINEKGLKSADGQKVFENCLQIHFQKQYTKLTERNRRKEINYRVHAFNKFKSVLNYTLLKWMPMKWPLKRHVKVVTYF